MRLSDRSVTIKDNAGISCRKYGFVDVVWLSTLRRWCVPTKSFK